MAYIDLASMKTYDRHPLSHSLSPTQVRTFAAYMLFSAPDAVCPGCGAQGRYLDACPNCGDPAEAGYWTKHTEECALVRFANETVVLGPYRVSDDGPQELRNSDD